MKTTSVLTTRVRPRTRRGRSRWVERPIASAALRAGILGVPFGAAAVCGLIVGWGIGGSSVGAELLRLAAAAAVSLAVFAAIERGARRFLPLVTLLKLSLVFPDRVPSRFSVALRSTSVRQLRDWAHDTQHDLGTAALAEKVVTLAAAMNSHDPRTRGHSERTRALADLLAVEMGLDEEGRNEVRWGAFLHDVGKILVPTAVLNKPGAPSPSEWEVLRRHPADGGRLVEPLRPFLGRGVEAVSAHHENYDGSGYPSGLAGEQIPLAARIVSVADSFEVMTAVRSYKKPMRASDAREELARHTGTQFDPKVVRALLNLSLGKVHWTLGVAAWAAEVPMLTVIPRAAAQVGGMIAGPTLSIGALSGIAAVSLGSVAAATPMPAAHTTTPPAAGALAHVMATDRPSPLAASHAGNGSGASAPLSISVSGASVGGAGNGSSSSSSSSSSSVTGSVAPARRGSPPTAPATPATPAVPTVGAPTAPATPAVPTVGAPTAPAVPTVRAPTAPATPAVRAPTAPATPAGGAAATPTTPGIPSVGPP